MPNIREHLLRDHQEHERLLERVSQSLAAKDPPEQVRKFWVPFERNLLDHLQTEDSRLFTVVIQAHRDEVLALRAEHRRIRYALMELSVSVELHTLKEAALENLRILLQRHTEHEEQSLHQWLEADEGICATRGLAAMLERRAHAAERLRIVAEEPESRT